MARKRKSAKRQKRISEKAPVPKARRAGLFQYLEDLPFKYQLLLAIFVLIVEICLLYPECVFQNKIFLASDARAAASFGAAAKQLPAGGTDYPLWNPFVFSGMPSFGSLAYTPYVYPVSFLLAAVYRLIPFPALGWLLFHTLLLGIGVFILLKDHGVGFLSAIAAAGLMMWMPNLVAVGANGHGSQACAVAYMPFALYFWDRLWRGKGALVNGSALAIVLGFQMLRAHLQIAYYTYALIGVHFIFFGALRLRDFIKGQVDHPFAEPPRFLAKLSGGTEGRSFGAAIIGVGWIAFILAVVVIASLLLSSALYMSVHDYSQHSIRAASEAGGLQYDYATSWSLHPLEMLTFLVPHAFGFGKDLYYGFMPFTDYPNYLGVFVILGAIAAVTLARTRFTKFLICLALISTLVSFGKFFPVLYGPLFKIFPYFDKFRVPVMILIVQQLAFVLLFAIGIDAVLRTERRQLQKVALWGTLGALIVFVVVVLSQAYWRGAFAESIADRIRNVRSSQQQLSLAMTAGSYLAKDLLKFSILLCAAFVMLLLYAKELLSKGFLIGSVIVFSLFDFYMVDRYIIHPEEFRKAEQLSILRKRKSYDEYLEADSVVSFLKRDERFFRIFPMDHPSSPFYGDFTSNKYMNSGISSIGGYHAAKLASYQNFLIALGQTLSRGRYHMLDMMNVRYIVSGYPIPSSDVFVPRWQGRDASGVDRYVYENLGALPRVGFVNDYRVAPGKEALDILSRSDIDVSSTVLLAKRPSVEPGSREGSWAKITNYSLNEIHMDTHVESASILVLSEVYYPRWRVFIDGVPGEIIRANYILRAVALTPGDHEIVFKYDAALFKRGILTSLVTFAVLVTAILLSSLFGKRRKVKWKHSS